MMRIASGAGLTRLDILSLLGVLALGLLHLPFPLYTDQALDLLTALELHAGSVLYRDFWDPRQPGIFLFYLLAGAAFGFDAVGLHLFELIYHLVFAVCLLFTLGPRFRERRIASLVPLFTIGMYYASILRSAQLTQVEGLVGFPLFYSLWFAAFPEGRGGMRTRLLLSGFLGGIVLQFKLLLLPIPASFWLAALLRRAQREDRRIVDAAARTLTPIVLGALASVIPFAVYVAGHGIGDRVLWTFFVFPPQVMDVYPHDIRALAGDVAWYFGASAPLIVLAMARVTFVLRGEAGMQRDPLTTDLVVWVLAGVFVSLVQIWWSYHWLVLTVPVGILAARGLDDLVAGRLPLTARHRRLLRGVLMASAIPIVLIVGVKAFRLVRNGMALSAADRIAFRSAIDHDYAEVLAGTAFLREPTSHPGPIYVLGDARVLFLSGRRQAIPVAGSSPLMWTTDLWEEVASSLAGIRPPYIFVHADNEELIDRRGHSLARLLEQEYRLFERYPTGAWYALVTDSTEIQSDPAADR